MFTFLQQRALLAEVYSGPYTQEKTLSMHTVIFSKLLSDFLNVLVDNLLHLSVKMEELRVTERLKKKEK